MVAALYRSQPGDDWREVDLLARHASGALVVREIGPHCRGVILARLDQVRVTTDVVLKPEAA